VLEINQSPFLAEHVALQALHLKCPRANFTGTGVVAIVIFTSVVVVRQTFVDA